MEDEENYDTMIKRNQIAQLLEKYSKFRDKKIQYCQDVNSFQLDLQILCNANQNPCKLYHGYQQIDSKVLWTGKDPEQPAGYGKRKTKLANRHYSTSGLTVQTK